MMSEKENVFLGIIKIYAKTESVRESLWKYNKNGGQT